MTVGISPLPRRLPTLPGPLVQAGVLAALAAVCAAGLAVAGPLFLVPPLALAAVYAMVAWPRKAAFALLVAGVAIDPATIGFTAGLSRAVWEQPSPFISSLPIKTNSFEMSFALLSAIVLVHPAFRNRSAAPPLPLLPRLIPAVILAGFAWGMAHGGAIHIAYHELRGLVFGLLAFAVAWRMRLTQRDALRLALWATVILGVAAVVRYALYLSGGRSGEREEFWFAHETGLFLAFGFVLGCALLLRARNDRERFLLVAYSVLMAAAMMMTGRRAAILVVLVGLLVCAWLLLPKRPVLLATLGIVVLLSGAAYLGAYWDAHSGPLAQPARAIRSQFDPDARDASSDEYRETERYDLQETIRQGEIFGVGFGRPFTQFKPLPELEFWPLQFYTPHQNILWIWLKMGIAGVAVLFGTWVIAFSRCVAACRAVPRWRAVPVGPMVLAATLMMYLAYARVDLAFVGARAAVPLGVAMALVFLPGPQTSRK